MIALTGTANLILNVPSCTLSVNMGFDLAVAARQVITA